MDPREIARKNEQTDRRLNALERHVANLPVRWPRPGGGGLPDGTKIGSVLMIVDSAGTKAFEYPIFHEVT